VHTLQSVELVERMHRVCSLHFQTIIFNNHGIVVFFDQISPEDVEFAESNLKPLEFRVAEVDGFRYRVENAMRAVTRVWIFSSINSITILNI
jgi:hypothetical protein